jgi:hypothetical protein
VDCATTYCNRVVPGEREGVSGTGTGQTFA